jgi:hypothetical protein
MGDIVNLRRVRKRAMRQEHAAKAAENRLMHGQPKAERILAETRAAKVSRNLDLHRMQRKNDTTGEGR